MNKVVSILKKIFSNVVIDLLLLFVALFFVYYCGRVWSNINATYKPIKIFAFLLIAVDLSVFIHLLVNKKLTVQNTLIILLVAGILLRMAYGLTQEFATGSNGRQHDVSGATGTGHYGYALYIFRNNALPDVNTNQLYQPPLNAILQAIWMHFNNLFIKPSEEIKEAYAAIFNGELKFKTTTELTAYLDKLYSTNLILGTYYSCITAITVYYIVKELNIKDSSKIIIVAFTTFQPVLSMMSGTLNNDNLSFMFFFLALLLAIKWYKNPRFITAILMAISIGCGMITKLSIGFIALLIGPMIIVRFIKSIKEKNWVKILLQIAVFGIIVFPLGLSFAIRNYVKLGQELTYILRFSDDSWLRDEIRTKTFYERFLCFPLKDLIDEKYGIFHNYTEYNIWIDLLKTSSFEEFPYVSSSYPFAAVMLITHALIYILGFASIVYIIVRFFMKKYQSDILFTIISIFLVILALGSYVSLNIKMPFSCTSNYRYIAYLAFAGIGVIALALENIKIKWIHSVVYSIVGIFLAASTIFVLVVA